LQRIFTYVTEQKPKENQTNMNTIELIKSHFHLPADLAEYEKNKH